MAALISAPIQPLIAEYRARLERDTFALVAGSYLHGSIALGAFDPDRSDIDFITLLHRPCTPDELAALSALHADLARKYPQWPMEGNYLTGDHDVPAMVLAGGRGAPIGDHSGYNVPTRSAAVAPSRDDIGASAFFPAASYHDGRFHPRSAYDLNPVTWWLLRYHAISLFGPKPSELGLTIEWETVRAYVEHNLDTYWRAWAYHPKRMPALLTDEGVQWAVLGILRLHYALNEHGMISKAGAGEYGLRVMPAKWNRLIQEALRSRRGKSGPLYRSRVGRAIEAVRFLRTVIAFA